MSERIYIVQKKSSYEDLEIRFQKWSKNLDSNITCDVKLFCILFKIVIVSCKSGRSNNYLHNIKAIGRG